jgi:hypothetical protein
MKNTIIGLSHMFLLLFLMVIYFEVKPESWKLLHDLISIFGILGLINILLSITFDLNELNEKNEV